MSIEKSMQAAYEAEVADHHKTLDAAEKAADHIDEQRNAIIVATAEIARLQSDLKNTSRDYSELRESYDKLFERHRILCEKHNEILRKL